MSAGSKTTKLSVFDFRSFLNIGMLLQESEVAKNLRSRLLDLAIGSIRERRGSRKHINQNDQTFLPSYIGNTEIRKKFTTALKNYVEGNNVKYAHFTNRVYKDLFGENANEYRKLLELSEREDIRSTLYREILDVISGYEEGIAEALETAFVQKGHMLSMREAEQVFADSFKSPFLRRPKETARMLMASRDNAFREIIHEALLPYLDSISPEEYEQFLGDEGKIIGDKTQKFLKILEKNSEVFNRLKDR